MAAALGTLSGIQSANDNSKKSAFDSSGSKGPGAPSFDPKPTQGVGPVANGADYAKSLQQPQGGGMSAQGVLSMLGPMMGGMGQQAPQFQPLQAPVSPGTANSFAQGLKGPNEINNLKAFFSDLVGQPKKKRQGE